MDDASLNHPALLPAGLRDVLPPEAEVEARSVELIMDCFAAYGFQRVKPPLLEFEESLFGGSGAATAEQTFRLMDPDSQRMMGLRADTTPQIARLAVSRMKTTPRPLRLAYAGQCLRVRGSHLQPERQIAQAGIELIGPDSAEADAEIVLMAAEALAAVGMRQISFDLTVPRLVLSLLEGVPGNETENLKRALDRKDSAAISAIGGPAADCLLKLLQAVGPAERALPELLKIELPPKAKAQAERMAAVVSAIKARNQTLTMTTDPMEFRGYQYHTGICVTVFASGRQAELGRGGRYVCGDIEPATGMTLYPDMIVRVAPPINLRPRIFLPYGTGLARARDCHSQGFATIFGLSPAEIPALEAARLHCSHVLSDGKIVPTHEEAK
jgi:ATP phosphoribosyltransferase regulatory subunit